MTRTTTIERFEDGELVERVIVVEDEPAETPRVPFYPNVPIPSPCPNPPQIQPGSPYIGDPPWHQWQTWCQTTPVGGCTTVDLDHGLKS